MSMRLLGVATFLFGFLVGCSSERPPVPFGELVEVSGVVKRGGKPLSGGVVQFLPEANKDDFLVNSEVATDGKFALSTVRVADKRGERKAGALAGKYRVVYRFVLSAQSGPLPDPL